MCRYDALCFPEVNFKKSVIKLLIDIPDNKAAGFMEIIKNYSYVKAKPISGPDSELLDEINDKKAFKNSEKIKSGKLKDRYVAAYLPCAERKAHQKIETL